MGRIHFKRAIKRGAGWLSIANRMLAPPACGAGICIFAYHRVANVGFVDPWLDDWNVSPQIFERQLAAISTFGRIIPLRNVLTAKQDAHPRACLTFDDGFANFHRQALPVLKRYAAHATLFVPTSSIGSTEPMPFDRWAIRNRGRVSAETWLPLCWQQLEQCVASGLVSIGSHSHRHLNGRGCSPGELTEEAGKSRDILVRRLGAENVWCYAYPYGNSRLRQVTPAYVNAVRDAGYGLAVSTDLGLVNAESDPLLLPRVEAHPLDSPAVMRAKMGGALAPYYFTDRLRRAQRA